LPGRTLRKSELSPNWQWLVDLMQELGFGRVQHLAFTAGEPLRDPPPRIYRHRRLTGANHERAESTLSDFMVKSRVLRLREELGRLGSGMLASLDVRDGLPYGITLEESDRP
jgi:hypothetical protein